MRPSRATRDARRTTAPASGPPGRRPRRPPGRRATRPRRRVRARESSGPATVSASGRRRRRRGRLGRARARDRVRRHDVLAGRGRALAGDVRRLVAGGERPRARRSSGSAPLTGPARPEPVRSRSMPRSPAPHRDGLGQVSEARGASASTCTVAVAPPEALPARSRTIPTPRARRCSRKPRPRARAPGPRPSPRCRRAAPDRRRRRTPASLASRYQPPPSGARSGVIAGGAGPCGPRPPARLSDHGPARAAVGGAHAVAVGALALEPPAGEREAEPADAARRPATSAASSASRCSSTVGYRASPSGSHGRSTTP